LMIAKCLLTVFLPPADWAIITAIKMQTRSLVVGVEVVTGGDCNKEEGIKSSSQRPISPLLWTGGRLILFLIIFGFYVEVA